MRLLVRQDLCESPTRGWYKHRVRCLRQETQRFQGSLQESRDNPKKSDRLQTSSGFPVFLTRSTPLFLPLIGFHRRGPGPPWGGPSFSLEQGRGPCPSLVSMSVVFPVYDLPTNAFRRSKLLDVTISQIHPNAHTNITSARPLEPASCRNLPLLPFLSRPPPRGQHITSTLDIRTDSLVVLSTFHKTLLHVGSQDKYPLA